MSATVTSDGGLSIDNLIRIEYNSLSSIILALFSYGWSFDYRVINPFAIWNTELHWGCLWLSAMSLADQCCQGHSQGRSRCCLNSWNWDGENSYILDATAFLTKRQCTDYCNPIEHFRKAECQVAKEGWVRGYFHQCRHSNYWKLSGMCLSLTSIF